MPTIRLSKPAYEYLRAYAKGEGRSATTQLDRILLEHAASNPQSHGAGSVIPILAPSQAAVSLKGLRRE